MFQFDRIARKHTDKPSRITRPQRHASAIESLESRRLLSAAVATMHYDATVIHPAAGAAPAVMGFSPSQISQLYGFSNITFPGGVPANGAGQTIAIVDAYNDPMIASDLAVFDGQFNLPAPPSLTVLNQTGGATPPLVNGGWDGEISLDVEWSHAIAPAAKIVLVEANSESTDDLMAAVNFARSYACR